MNPSSINYLNNNKSGKQYLLSLANQIYFEMDIYTLEDAILWLS